MGTTFSIIQIENHQLKAEQLKKEFCKYMKKKGLVASAKEKAEYSYRIAFSNNSNWATLCSLNLDGSNIKDEAENLAKILGTYCIATSIWHSDMIELSLYGASSEQQDTIFAGTMPFDESSDDSAKYKGIPEKWKPLFSNGTTWRQIKDVLENDYTFVENMLIELAPLLGIDSKNIAADYSCIEENPNDFDFIELHFKSKDQAFVKEGPTKLKMFHMSFAVTDESHCVSFYNCGGISKGVSVILYGDCFENEEVEIGEMTLEKTISPRSPKEISNGTWEREMHSAIARKYKTPNGVAGLCFDFNNFEFHEGIDTKNSAMKGKKGDDTIFAHSCCLRFTPTKKLAGKQRFRFVVVPHENQLEGQTTYIMVVYDTRDQLMEEAFEDFDRMDYYPGY
jgi:hypothetical protein